MPRSVWLNSLKPITVLGVLAAALLVATFPNYPAEAQETPDKERRDVLTATATWALGSENDIERTLNLFVDKSRVGIDIFVSMTTESGDELLGRYFTEDKNIFTIDKNLDEASLNQVSIDVCHFEQVDENGNCTEVIETIEVQAQWSSTGTKATIYDSHRTTLIDRQMILFHGSNREASAVGSVNSADLDSSLFASLSRAKLLAVNFVEPNKPPRLDLFGNKGVLIAQAAWLEATVDGQPARIFLDASEEIKGATTIDLLIRFESDDGPEFMQGRLVISPDSQEDVFVIDMREATAKLSPVDVTVCDIELAGECSDAPSATYTVEAEWDGIEQSASTESITTKSKAGDSRSRVGYDAVVMGAEVTGSIEGKSLEDAAVAVLFHFANFKVVFK